MARAHTVQEAHLSPGRIAEFKKGFLGGRESIGAAKKAFDYFGRYKRVRSTGGTSFGVDEKRDPRPFIDDSLWFPLNPWWYAVAQERFLLEILETKLRVAASGEKHILPSPIRRTPRAILDSAEALIARLEELGLVSQLILIGAPLTIDQLRELYGFLDTPHRHADRNAQLPQKLSTNWILGMHHGAVVLHAGDLGVSHLYVADLSRFGKLVQYGPDDADISIDYADEGSRELRLRIFQAYDVEVNDPSAVWAAAFEAEVVDEAPTVDS